MKIRIMTVAGLAFMLASAVGAQTKFTGTVTCAKPDPNYKIDAPDHPGHSYSLEKDSCSWGADTLINGLKITDDTGVGTGENDWQRKRDDIPHRAWRQWKMATNCLSVCTIRRQ